MRRVAVTVRPTCGAPTVDDGWGWIFTAVEHWKVCRLACLQAGDRFAALQPISACRAVWLLALRMDHGSQYLSDHFTNQIKFWGKPSYAFVAERPTASPSGSIAR